jgi:cytochrome b6-f complex iron-sulfur subunit
MNLSSSTPEGHNELPRRGLLKGLMGFSILATIAGVVTPIIGYLWPPARQRGGQGGRVRAGSLVEVEAAGGMVVSAGDQPIVLTYSESAGVKAFSAICTHLGCVVRWHSAGNYIECPCHDGRFNGQTGAVISGPPPSPLPVREIVVEGDDIFVTG